MTWNLRHLLATAVLLVATVGCGGSSGGPATVPAGSHGAPTIVLVTVDAVPSARLKLYGGVVATPALDRLVAAGGVALQGWTAVPMTRPAVASMMTGLGADRHGVVDDIYTPLGDTTPLLAESLQRAGYKTAAFPGTPFLETASGVDRGFEVVDEPDEIPFGTPQRIVHPIAAGKIVEHALLWLRSVNPSDHVFLWVHFGETCTAVPGLFDSAPDGSDLDHRIAAEDAALVQLLTGLQSLSRLDGAEILWTATYGDVSKRGSRIPGPGFSPNENAVRVPLVYRAAPGRRKTGTTGTTWGPDVAVTLAAAGATAVGSADGADLAHGVPGDRTIFAWSTAPLDQMGWKPWTAGLRGNLRVAVGLIDEGGTLDGAAVPAGSPELASLREAVVRRQAVPTRSVPLATVASLLEKRGIKIDPVPETGRSCGTIDQCATIASELWEARWMSSHGGMVAAVPHFEAALALDPLNLGAKLEWGINNSGVTLRPKGKALFEETVRRYPSAPQALHWFGHSFDRNDPAQAAQLWEAVVSARPRSYDVLYDIACMRALTGDLKGSLNYLRQAIRAGYRTWDHLQTDPDLREVRGDPAFADLMREFHR